MKNKSLFDLQLFADEADTSGSEQDAGAKGTDESEAESENKPTESTGKTYTDEDVDKIVKSRLARAEKKWESERAEIENKAKAEGERLAKMNEDQKKQYEAEKKDREIQKYKDRVAELEAEQLRGELAKSASEILKKDHDIVATQYMLDFVVGKDADSTQANIKKLVSIILDDRKLQDEKRAIGRTPQVYQNKGGTVDPYAKIANKYKKG